MTAPALAGAQNFFSGPGAWLRYPSYGLYRALVAGRLTAYRRGWLKTHSAPRPVVSVGNLTAGGGGKTPVVDYLLRTAVAQGLKPACLSRGYGREGRAHLLRVRVAESGLPDPRRVGDEPALLARGNPQVPLYIGADRVAAAWLAEAWDAPHLLVLDDGFQHLRLHRDLNLLLIEAEHGLGNGRTLPLGPLREPVGAARRADAVLLTKAGLAAPGHLEGLRTQLQTVLPADVPVFTSDYRPARLRRLDGGAVLDPASLKGQSLGLVCAIAQPSGFVRAVEQLGVRVETLRCYRDHHPYGAAEVRALDETLTSAPGDRPAWLTTDKDAVKLAGRLQHADRLWVLEMEVLPEAAFGAFFFDFLHRHGLL